MSYLVPEKSMAAEVEAAASQVPAAEAPVAAAEAAAAGSIHRASARMLNCTSS